MSDGNGRRSGHRDSPFGGVIDPITANRLLQVTANLSSAPLRWLDRLGGGGQGGDGDPRRDIDDECGYPKTLTIENYRAAYERDPIARRVVQVLARESWQVRPEVRESEDANRETEFEKAFQALDEMLRGEQSFYESRDGKSSPFWDVCRSADELCGVGAYGVILLGLDDALDESGGLRGFDKPVAGVEEANSVPVAKGKLGANIEATPGRWSLTTNAERQKQRRLLWLRSFDQSCAAVVEWENNPTSPRYGKPVAYQVGEGAGLWTPGGSVVSSGALAPSGTFKVHWTRVAHVVDNPENSEIFHTPRLHPHWNRLYNIRKIAGADGEACWRNALQKFFFGTHPQLGGDVDIDLDGMRDDLENMMNGLQHWMALRGMSVQAVAPTISDPTPHVNSNIDAICIGIPCPKRVFMGSERGELASSQDDAAWNDTLRARQNNHCGPRVAIPLIDRLILAGVLPRPAKKYTLVWPDLESLSEDAAATVANKWADALTKFVSGQLENIIDPLDFFTRVCRLGEEEAKAILERTLNWVEYQAWSQKLHSLPAAEGEEEETPDEFPGDVPPGAGHDGVSVGHPPAAPVPELGGEELGGLTDALGEEGAELTDDEETEPAENAFCPTGEGGGRKPDCSPGGGVRRVEVGGTVWITSKETGKDHPYRVVALMTGGRLLGKNDRTGIQRMLKAGEWRTPQEQTDKMFGDVTDNDELAINALADDLFADEPTTNFWSAKARAAALAARKLGGRAVGSLKEKVKSLLRRGGRALLDRLSGRRRIAERLAGELAKHRAGVAAGREKAQAKLTAELGRRRAKLKADYERRFRETARRSDRKAKIADRRDKRRAKSEAKRAAKSEAKRQKGLAKVDKARSVRGRASERANKLSAGKLTPQGRARAAKAHREAARLHAKAGNRGLAALHRDKIKELSKRAKGEKGKKSKGKKAKRRK